LQSFGKTAKNAKVAKNEIVAHQERIEINASPPINRTGRSSEPDFLGVLGG
jgi:hypothetical protein